MADENSRYNVSISLEITDATTGEPTPFSKTIQEYSNMKYEHIVALQSTAIPVLVQTLLSMGESLAEEVKAKREGGKSKTDKFTR